MRVAPFALGYAYAIVVALGLAYGGAWTLAPAILTFVVLPVLDAFVGVSWWNPNADDEARLRADLGFRILTWAWVPVGLTLTILALGAFADPARTLGERIALAAGVGLMNGVVGITYAHELVHQPARFEQFLGEVLLTMVSYPHFRVEHVFGHHKHVGTPRDPATSRRGESFYAYFARTVPGQARSAWQLERERLVRGSKPAWRNRLVWYACALAAVYAAIVFVFGGAATALFALQSIVAFASLEVVNYVEHYGLARREVVPGRYEPAAPRHSWNAGNRVSNWVLINLARHSDHHAVASRRYQLLRTYDGAEAPQLPYGYGSMFLLALVPPLWFRVMNPRLNLLAISQESASSAFVHEILA